MRGQPLPRCTEERESKASMLQFWCRSPRLSCVNFILVHRRANFLQRCGVFLLLAFSAGDPCSAQSARAAPADSVSRAAAVYQQGMSALQNGDLSGARAAFEKVLRLAPQSPEGHNSLGWVLLAQGEIDPAIGPERFGDASHPGASARFLQRLRWRGQRIAASDRIGAAKGGVARRSRDRAGAEGGYSRSRSRVCRGSAAAA